MEAQRQADDTLDHETPLEELFEEQLNSADLIVLTKTDLVGADTLARVEAEVRRQARPQARLLRVAHGQAPSSAVLGLGMAAEDDLDTRPSQHEDHDEHDHDDFASVVLTPGPFASVDAVTERVRAAIERNDLLRVKGTVRIDGKPMRLVVQAAGPRLEVYFDKPWGEAEQPRLVAIAASGTDWGAVEAALQTAQPAAGAVA